MLIKPENDYLDYKQLFTKKRKTFLNAVDDYIQEQERILFEIINSNKNTKYGRKYNFANIGNIKDFQNTLPITKYDDYSLYIEEIMEGKQNILTSDKVLLLEPTGGSSSGSKYIPYTQNLKQAFNKGFEPWLSDLFLKFPNIINNPMYWSITPSSSIRKIKSKIPIGFDNDLEYLYPPFKDIIAQNIIIPDIRNSPIDDFYTNTLKELKDKTDLALVSIWNPTLFLNIIDKEQNLLNIWEKLQVISCWDEGNAKPFALKLQNMFPGVYIQGKGLLATEGIMTIPIEGIGKLPCVQSHFYEFIDIKNRQIKLLNELEEGKEYSIILTTQGGLYRYKIGDIIKVYAKYKNCPLLAFQGRENNISDYFGEKLNERFVKNMIQKLDIDKKTEFYMFAPYFKNNKFYYTIYIEGDIDTKKLEILAEEYLKQNYHYKYAREIGQINKFRFKRIKNGHKQYLDNCVKKGQKLGDIKPIIFSNKSDWNFRTEDE